MAILVTVALEEFGAELTRMHSPFERDLPRMFTDTLCELETRAIAERMVAPAIEG